MARIILAPRKEWMAASREENPQAGRFPTRTGGEARGYCLANNTTWISITLVPVGPVLK